MPQFVVTYNINANDDLRNKVKDKLNEVSLLEQNDNQSTHFGPYASANALVILIRDLIQEDNFIKDDYITLYYCKDSNVNRYRIVDDGEKK